MDGNNIGKAHASKRTRGRVRPWTKIMKFLVVFVLIRSMSLNVVVFKNNKFGLFPIRNDTSFKIKYHIAEVAIKNH